MAESLFNAVPRPHVRHLAIGVFDGVHRGHVRILQEIMEDLASPDEAAVLTFEPHPLAFIAPDLAPPRLTTETMKVALIRAAGVPEVVVVNFDQELQELSAEDFAYQIHRVFPHLVEIVVGPDWRFGKGRTGSVDTMRILGLAHGFFTSSLKPVSYQDAVISSTRIREAIVARSFAEVEVMLGRSYAVQGEVVRGDGRGREIGFSTANLGQVEQLLPPAGVYAGKVRVGEEQYRAVINHGTRPTVSSQHTRVVEAHLLGFSGDLYGQVVEIADWKFLREEQKFADVAALREQITRDVQSAENLLG